MKVILFVSLSQVVLCMVIFGLPVKDEEEPYDGCDNVAHHSDQISPLHMIMEANNKFAYKFYALLANENPKKNIFFSPLSISILFSMISAGAKGRTQAQILEGLRFNTSWVRQEDINKGYKEILHKLNHIDGSLELNIFNALFVEKNTALLENFSKDLKNYQAEFISTDFQNSIEAKNQINGYVENKTKGEIKDLVDRIDPLTLLVAVNTIFFKGSWLKPFNKNFTREADFHVDDKTVVKVPMMSKEDKYLVAFVQDVGCDVVQLPYEGNFSAILVLPNPGKLPDVERAIENGALQMWINQMRPMKIVLQMPRFKISAKTDLKKELLQCGIEEAFSDNADLSGITGSRNLKVSQADHKAVLSVDETGTVAAAASAAGITTLSLPLPIVVDHPFLILTIDVMSKLVAFMGKVVQPEI